MILIFGASGLMGTAITKTLDGRGLKYKALSHKDVDITKYRKVENIIGRLKPEYVINCAGIVGSSCENKKKSTIKVNAEAVLNLSNLCRKHNSTLIHLSTMGVYDKCIFYEEDVNPNASTLYGSTKLLGERYIINNCHKYYIIRLPMIFSRTSQGGTLNNIFKKLKNNETIYGTTNAVYRFGHSEDMANALIDISIVDNYSYGIYHIYNEGYDNIYSLLLYTKKIIRSNSEIIPQRMDKKVMLCTFTWKYKTLRHYKKALRDING